MLNMTTLAEGQRNYQPDILELWRDVKERLGELPEPTNARIGEGDEEAQGRVQGEADALHDVERLLWPMGCATHFSASEPGPELPTTTTQADIVSTIQKLLRMGEVLAAYARGYQSIVSEQVEELTVTLIS